MRIEAVLPPQKGLRVQHQFVERRRHLQQLLAFGIATAVGFNGDVEGPVEAGFVGWIRFR